VGFATLKHFQTCSSTIGWHGMLNQPSYSTTSTTERYSDELMLSDLQELSNNLFILGVLEWVLLQQFMGTRTQMIIQGCRKQADIVLV
jgi:hypothetical protein